jgi:hypothetical protein
MSFLSKFDTFFFMQIVHLEANKKIVCLKLSTFKNPTFAFAKTRIQMFSWKGYLIGNLPPKNEYDGNVFVAWVLQVRRAEVVTK